MQKKYILLGALGSAAVYMAAGKYSSPLSSVEFTKPALPAPQSIDVRATLSPAHVVVPIKIDGLAARVERTLPDGAVNIKETVGDSVCAKRTPTALYVECADGRLEGTIMRLGAVDMQVTPEMIKLSYSAKYDLTLTGMGWARAYTEQKAGETKVEVGFVISTRQNGSVDVQRVPMPTNDEQVVKLFRANLKLARLMDAQLKPFVKLAEDDLRRAVAALPIQTALSGAWTVLSQPLELGRGSGMWLKGAPDVYMNGTLVSANGKLHYQIPIASHLSMVESEKAQGANSKRVAQLSQEPAPTGPSRLRVAVPVDLEAMRQQAQAAFPRTEVFETRSDRFSEPVKVSVLGTRVYPAARQIGLELDIKVTTARGITSGKLNLAGRPSLDANTGTVTLVDVTFPAVGGKDTGSQAPGVPRIGAEPFASRFMSAAKLDISRALSEVLPRASQLLDQPLGNDLKLSAQLNKAEPIGFEMTRDGAWLIVDLTGDVQITYEGPSSRIVDVAPPEAPAGAAVAAVATSPVATVGAVAPSSTIASNLGAIAAPGSAAALAAATAVAAQQLAVKATARKPEPKTASKPQPQAVSKPQAQAALAPAKTAQKPAAKPIGMPVKAVAKPPVPTKTASTGAPFKPYNY